MKNEATKIPQAGNLLISEPFLQDENFVRSVVLLCEHNAEGSFGLVLNKPSILHLSELVEELSFLENEVFVGGPVEQNTLHFIYFGEKSLEGSIAIGEHLWWGGDFESLVEHLKSGILDPHDVRFFIGYSGWGSGQLSDELGENTWIVCDHKVEPNVLENTPDELWRLLLKNMGGEFKVIANYPLDPRLN
ncbi:YqgE/AlgH family protein [Algoriphagus sp. H41]|uniref:YqgE/AlgH family protein n=1 Tax=Algoriphagus oliviformis TaxID=2811231 RepID=A0ABS3C153_9BACT|nr:YqgE/AlgH family protein [Algoriphagus oliviformis]MBN7810844.1 YqgE/AlgH family protein [Algoriphagus oliviformis]